MQRYAFFHKDEKSSRVFLSLTYIFRSAQSSHVRVLLSTSRLRMGDLRTGHLGTGHLGTNLQKIIENKRKKITDNLL